MIYIRAFKISETKIPNTNVYPYDIFMKKQCGLDDSIYPDSLYLLDEPEMSLSPQNQVLLAEKINEAARYLSCQFIVATHSPFMLGTLQGKNFNLDSKDFATSRWSDLENVRYFYEFFKKNEKEF